MPLTRLSFPDQLLTSMFNCVPSDRRIVSEHRQGGDAVQCGRAGTTRFAIMICTGSSFWLNVVVRILMMP